jgi:hypothetical protein
VKIPYTVVEIASFTVRRSEADATLDEPEPEPATDSSPVQEAPALVLPPTARFVRHGKGNAS